MLKNIPVTRSSMPGYEEYCEEIKELWDSKWLTHMGVKHQKLQAELEKRLGVKHVVLFVNGHLALENIIDAMQFPAGSEVITTPFTFASTTQAIVRNHLTPVFCDIDPITFTIDASKIESLITEKTVAIVPVHVYGNICDVETINAIAKKYNLKVIYDAAHAFGETYKGIGIANYGDASMFSFHATKVFNTIEGGSVCLSDDALTERLNDLKYYGMHSADSVPYIGSNAKMHEFSAAMGICNLRHFDEEILKRKNAVERYRSNLQDVDGIQLNTIQKNVVSNYAYFPIIIDKSVFGVDRDELCNGLKNNKIFARKYFYPLTSSFDCYKGRFSADNTPIALDISLRVLTLPLYADLSKEDVDRICDVILRCKK